MDSTWLDAFKLEQTIAQSISTQAKHGCNFDTDEAKRILNVLEKSIARLDRRLVQLLPPDIKPGFTIEAPYKLNGEPKLNVLKKLAPYGYDRDKIVEIGGPITIPDEPVPFDMSKTAKLKEVMLTLGWVPDEWNAKKNTWKPFIRSKMTPAQYSRYIEEMRDDERENFYTATTNYYNKHFNLSTGKVSEGHRTALLHACGFKTTPKNMEQFRRHMLQLAFWPSSPQITETSFETVSQEHGIALTLLKKRMVTAHRRGLINGLIEKLDQRRDGKLSGEANPCATPTARMTHRIIANIPSSGSPLGERCRALFMGDYYKGDGQEWEFDGHRIPAGQHAFVGGDGAGLELRMLAHYLVAIPTKLLSEEDFTLFKKDALERALESAKQYRDVLLTGDIHTHNQNLAGLPTRAKAKTFIYAFLYGAGDANLGAQLGGDKEVGATARATFLRECPCIPVLIEYIQWFANEHKYVPGIDGRKLRLRRDENGKLMTHKALNLLLQAAGSIVMKRACRVLMVWIEEEDLDCHQVIFYHDEFQFSCRPAHVERLRYLIDNCVRVAGEELGMHCPLASDSKAGVNWLHTH